MNMTSAYEWTPNTLLAGFPGLLLTTYYQQQIISIPAGFAFLLYGMQLICSLPSVLCDRTP